MDPSTARAGREVDVFVEYGLPDPGGKLHVRIGSCCTLPDFHFQLEAAYTTGRGIYCGWLAGYSFFLYYKVNESLRGQCFEDADAIKNAYNASLLNLVEEDNVLASMMEVSGWNQSENADLQGDVEYYLAGMEATRFWIQRVLVPIVAAVGIAGNSITMLILTRKEMRSSINWYLTGLAAADLLYLVFVFSLSFRHYPWNMPLSYWHYYPVGLWLSDSSRRSEGGRREVGGIGGRSEGSEGGRRDRREVGGIGGRSEGSEGGRRDRREVGGIGEEVSSNTSVWLTVSFTVERYLALKNPLKGKVWFTESRAKRVIALVYILCFLSILSTPFEWRVQESQLVQGDHRESQISLVLSNLGANPGYRKGFYWFTATVFILVPLTLLLVFNILLIYHVHWSSRQRALLMAHRSRQEIRENRVTVMLIAVSVLFLLCQSPTALVLIYSSFHHPIPETRGDYVLRICGNVFNFLMAVNAATNFLLYCALSDRYRRNFLKVCRRCDSGRRDSFTTGENSRRYTNSSPGHPQPHLYRTSLGSVDSERERVESHPMGHVRPSDGMPGSRDV
ncbi:unnamed protein product [Darwinula stevensoni]|uniref:G-protein coupled receptors family 1 profile domain-containing protein n=1 Tax=Darwinula stevensoni TaxID=69355 RepID=A0A7R9A6W2_9CRUS|nr:unnamed protein product [Darwinula stevensoni]CAG0889183.1 unnamed protein product [Darwinula stevensoni]